METFCRDSPSLAVGSWSAKKAGVIPLSFATEALRLEVVLSVDGLDVIDGRTASFGKRGYVIEPHRQLVVEGFRQSTDAVAAFRFGPVRESYANQKYGDTRNVGVIGIAIFNERGTNPWTDREVEKRLKADPFPGRFATPP